MCIVSNVGDTSFDDVVPKNQFKENEVESRQLGPSDEEEPVYDGNECLREQDKVGAGYGGDSAACTEDGAAAEESMACAGKDSTGKVETDVSDVAELIVDVIAEEVEKEHISDDVHKSAVEKGITNELPHLRTNGIQHKVPDPGAKADAAGDGVNTVLGKEDETVDGNEGIICIRCPPGPNACSQG